MGWGWNGLNFGEEINISPPAFTSLKGTRLLRLRRHCSRDFPGIGQVAFRYYPRLCGSLGHHGQKMVLGTPLPVANPTKLLFLTPNLHLDGTVAYFSLKKFLFFRFRAYLSISKQAPH
jgi:hypothetical protein